jgi:hypothetical protein
MGDVICRLLFENDELEGGRASRSLISMSYRLEMMWIGRNDIQGVG